MKASVISVHAYPLKSGRAIASLPALEIKRTGITADRRFMLAEPDLRNPGHLKMVTQRTPGMESLATVGADIFQPRLAITFRDFAKRETVARLDPDKIDEIPVRTNVHDNLVHSQDTGDAMSDAFSSHFGRKLRLLHLPGERGRNMVGAYAPQNGDKHRFGFADGAPLLITTLPSLRQVHDWIGHDNLAMAAFRPNIVLDGDFDAFAEDGWLEIGIGNQVRLMMHKPCDRCVIPQIDQKTGIKRDDNQPTKALHEFRRVGKSRFFGENAVVLQGGTIRAGDEVTVMQCRQNAHPLLQGIAYTGLRAS